MFCNNEGKNKVMMRFNFLWVGLLAMVMMLSSCELIGDIFQAGMWVGVIIVVGIIALLFWIISKFRR